MKYKVYCEIDSKWEEFETLLPREVCPADSNHTVRAGSLSMIGESNKDYKTLRQDLMVQVATEGFSNLSTEEKKIASANFVVSKADRDTVHTIEEQIVNGVLFHDKSVIARKTRGSAAKAEVYNRLQIASERANLMTDVSALLDAYIDFGIEGTVEGDDPGLFDYIESRVGTPFETTGLLSKVYTIEGMTINQLSAKLMDILKNGNY